MSSGNVIYFIYILFFLLFNCLYYSLFTNYYCYLGYFLLVLADGTTLTKVNNTLTTAPKDLLDHNQYFKYDEKFISSKVDSKLVFDILNNKKAAHSPI